MDGFNGFERSCVLTNPDASQGNQFYGMHAMLIAAVDL